jgi:hypothetical protein
MSNIDKINKLDEALAIAWLEDLVASENEAPVFKMDNTATHIMATDKKNKIIEQLYSKLSLLSFGELLTKSMSEQNISAAQLSGKAELNESFVKDLQSDHLAVNNIPVVLLKKLLNSLAISFTDAKKAILKTFEIVRQSTVVSEENFSVTPAFRRGKTNSDNNSYKRLPNKDLFENEESLNKYLERLEKLMQ